MKKTLKWLDINFEPLLIMVIFIAMTCLICLQVILRFFMGSGFAWGEEFATFMFVWLCFLGISYAFRNNRQISVDFLRNMLSEKPRKALVLLIDVSMLVLMGLFLYGAVQNVMTAAKYNDMAASVQVSLNVCYTAAVVGYFLSMIICFRPSSGKSVTSALPTSCLKTAAVCTPVQPRSASCPSTSATTRNST